MQDTSSLLSMAMREQVLSLCVLLGRARWGLLGLFPVGGWCHLGLFLDFLLLQSFANVVPTAVAFCSFDRGVCSNEQHGRVPFLDTQDQRCNTKNEGQMYLFQVCLVAEEQNYGHE